MGMEFFSRGPQYELRLGSWKVGGKQWDFQPGVGVSLQDI